MTGTIQQVLHVAPEPPSPDYHLVETMLDRFDPAAIPDRYRSAVGGQPRHAPGEATCAGGFSCSSCPDSRWAITTARRRARPSSSATLPIGGSATLTSSACRYDCCGCANFSAGCCHDFAGNDPHRASHA